MKRILLVFLILLSWCIALCQEIDSLPDSVEVIRDTLSTVTKYRVFNTDTTGVASTIYGPYTGKCLQQDSLFGVTRLVRFIPEKRRVIQQMDWKFYLFCFIVFILALLRLLFTKYFSDMFSVFFNTSVRQKQLKDQLSQSALPSLLLNLFYFITGGLFLHFLLEYKGMGGRFPVYISLVIWTALLAGVYLSKYLLIQFLGWVFNQKEAAENYVFVIFHVNKMTGIFILPFLIIWAYMEDGGKNIVLTLAVSGLCLLWVARLARAYLSINNILKMTIFHFLLYVIAFEIMPLMILYKLLVRFIT